ncbi:hypothetical protein CTU88_18290 [Streptomyces sp. JV178]|uniref:hypothetical protein n=1 Tax=Streptomyces sp. JV178 TaxID=858632 RepID=UPI000C1B38EA|nr:hypothetical protein [Streptomyces sp. JV178]PIM71129.1 hypothetical protein CTU88_18290 [Streptomyces sp. JV178]
MRGGPDARGLRLLGLTVAVACTLTLPLVASAGPLADAGDTMARRAAGRLDGVGAERLSADAGDAAGAAEVADAAEVGGRAGSGHRGDGSAGKPAVGPGDGPDDGPDDKAQDARGDAESSRSHMLLGLGLATAARCGPELTSPDGIEAQTCVLTQGEESWARTYYRNATGRELSSVLSVMGPGGRSVRMHCAVGAEDEPGVCETPRERTQGEPGAYTAVAEFAAPDGSGPLLLRSGSNSSRTQGR